MKKKYIFIPIYRSFGLRYLESLNLIEELSKNFEIVLFINEEKKEAIKKYFEGKKVIIKDLKIKKIKNNIKSIRINNYLKILRKFVYGETKYKNKTVEVNKVKFKEEIKKNKYFLIDFISLLLRKFKILRKLFVILDEHFDQKNVYLEEFQKYRPKFLITTSYGYDFDQYFVRDAKKVNCKTLSIIYSWDNPATKGYKLSDSDYYIVWNSQMKTDLINFHDIDSNKIFECGAAHWDIYFKDMEKRQSLKEEFFIKNKLDKEKKIILFMSSMPKDFSDNYKVIENILEIIKENNSLQLVVRMHPLFMDDKLCKKYLGNKSEYFENKLLEKYRNKLIFINPKIDKFGELTSETFYSTKDIEELKELYCSADIMLNQYSTSIIEGCIFNLPLINIGIGNYRDTKEKRLIIGFHNHLWELNKLNIIKNVYDYENLKKEIDRVLNLKNFSYDEKIIDKLVGPYKGSSSKFAMKKVFQLINET